MPEGLNGKDLAQCLLRGNSRLKVVYMSGYSPENVSKDLALREGVNFLRKPFQGPSLAHAIRVSLDA